MKDVLPVINTFEKYFQNENIFPENYLMNLYEPCSYFLSNSGKRIRPCLCLLAAEMLGEVDEEIYKLAVGIELFHNFTLLHDDIMDDAPLRRGRPTVHEKYSNSTAILSGDVLSIYAYKYITDVNSNKLPEILEVFNKTAIEVCEGQQLDMDYENEENVSLEEYLEMIRLKTSVLLGCSLKLAAISMDAKKEIKELLYDFGIFLGMAFQLKDDYLDTFGSKSEIGKLPGGDIRSNKKTALYIISKELSIKENVDWNKYWIIEDEELKVNEIIKLWKSQNIDKILINMIEEYSDKASDILNQLSDKGYNVAKLEQITNYLLHRKK